MSAGATGGADAREHAGNPAGRPWLEREIHTLTEGSPDIIMRFDRNLRHVYVNPAVEQQTGIPRNAFLGKTHKELGFHPSLVAMWESALEQTFTTAESRRLDFELPGGAWIDWLVMPVVDESGQVASVLTVARDISDRKRNEQILRESHAYLENIINNVPDAVYVKDREHSWVLVNDAFCRYMGHSREALLGQTDYAFFDRETADRFWASDVQVFTDGLPHVAELEIRLPDGTVRQIVTRKNLYVNERGSPFVVGSAQDVTELKAAESAVRRSNERYRIIAENAGDVVWILDADTYCFNFLSSLAGRAIGYSAGELAAYHLSQILTPESFDAARFTLEEAKIAARRGEDVIRRLELEERRKDGTTTWVEVTARVLCDAEGVPREVIGAARDINHRKRQEARLRYASELEHIIAEVSSELIALDSEEVGAGIERGLEVVGCFAHADRAYLLLYQDERWLECSHEWCRGGVTSARAARTRIPAGGASALGRLLSETGALRHDATNPALVLDSATRQRVFEEPGADAAVWLPVTRGDIAFGFVGFDRVRDPQSWDDVTCVLLAVLANSFANALARKRMEEQLRKAKSEAEAANRLKSRLVSNVSHEIRTPLNAIIGLSELILNAGDLAESQAHAAVVLREGEVLLALVNDLLDHAKLEAGKLELATEPFNLGELLERIVAASRVGAQKKGLDLVLDLDPRVELAVVGDALRLRQVLANLITNAVKFTRQGSVTVRVSLDEALEDVQMVSFSVIDTGIGIPTERQAAIFESFVQADQRTTREYGGTGLGTTIAKHLVELMGGSLGLDSEVGRGSTFWFEVPLYLNPLPAASTTRGSAETDRGERRSARILVAEDYPVNQQIVRAHLASAGHVVTVVDNGKQALAKCLTGRFDLILMDVNMPEMDGYEATRRLRAVGGALATLPILGLTASAEAHTVESCVECGMTAVLTKPIRRDTLLDGVDYWLGVAHGEHEEPRSTRIPLYSMRPHAPRRPEPPREPASDLDWPALAAQFGGDAALARRIAEQFVDSFADELATMRDALAQDDAGPVRARAHRLKGAAGSVTAHRVGTVVGRLEAAAEAGHLAEARELILPLTEAVAAFERALRAP